MDHNKLIRESKQAMDCVRSVCDHAGIDQTGKTDDELIDISRSIDAPCDHKWDRPYRGHGTRKCLNCGGLQSN